ncbi:phospholipid phosphatase-related protein type 4-like [Syngnathus typhle]|uniref:phospholipid phosphatase-related protein type 4-like n=1 Tax=Syngnathus typhle TaxID=161592 RepID=UPI002A6A4550|nr:phospholipid phosphatase-related protein type 4-like [Syngnathus typhle]
MTTLKRLKFGGETKESVTLLPCFYFVELPILALSVISLYFLEVTDIFQPVHSGYSCNDKSLSLPYIIPQKEVCPLPLLYSLAFAIPTATILIGEAILFCYLSRKSSTLQTEANISAAGCNFNSYIRRVVRFIGVHIFGLCVTAVITHVFQLSTGQHTPYWLDVCKPNLTHINISTCDEAFILEDICSGQDILIIAGRKSFPSQHASLAGFAAVYVSMYLNAVLTDSTKLLKPLLVFSFIMLAILAGLTRVIQFRNHPADVYCGWILGLAVATYLGIFAAGTFRPSEDKLKKQPLLFTLRKHLPSSFHSVCQSDATNNHQVGHHMLTASQPEQVNIRTPYHTLSPKQSEQILKRSSSYREPSQSNVKIASGNLEMLVPPSPMTNCDKTFNSSTLPRSHGGSSLEGGRIPRRQASVHTSMDSARSKQLLSQWKNKNDKRKLSLQVMDGIKPTSLSPQKDVQRHYPTESSCAGLDTDVQSGAHFSSATGQEAGAHIPASYIKIAASCVSIANKNPLTQNGGSGFAGGSRMVVQSRPGSSQLVHIPEEENSTSKDQESESEDSTFDVVGSAKQKWMRVAEKPTIPCRPLSAGGQPRLMQVISFSKQQGLRNSRSEDGGSTVSCTGSIRYRTLMDQDPSPPASTTGAIEGQGLERTGSIVRVEAHPKSNEPVMKPLTNDGSGSWRWNPSEMCQSLQQPAFNISDLHRNTENCDSMQDAGSLDGRQGVTGSRLESKVVQEGVHTNHPHIIYQSHSAFQDTNTSNLHTPSAVFAPPFHHHPQSITTIRVTPVEGTVASSECSSDSQSAASSSRESTLRRKSGTHIHFSQDSSLMTDHIICDKSNLFQNERGNLFQGNLEGFQDNPIHTNRHLEGMFGHPGPRPPPTLPRPLMIHSPPPNLGMAFKEA